MNEIVLGKRKNGMAALILTSILYIGAVALTIYGGIQFDMGKSPLLLAVGIVWMCIGWLPFLGLKILKPQEALVLTLFGKYVGTLKGDGFYCVNPFCVAVNPAANTELNQSGDVKKSPVVVSSSVNGASAQIQMPNKKISLKIMTLNNAKQKIMEHL